MRLSALARRHATDHVGAIFDGLLRMEGTLLACETLTDDFCVATDLEVRP